MESRPLSEITLSCNCKSKKTHRLLIDGDLMGDIVLELCNNHYSKQKKKFLREEDLT